MNHRINDRFERASGFTRVTAALFAAAVIAAPAAGQATDPTVFVSNNGNLEGSITSLRVESDGSLNVIDRIVTGMRDSTTQPCPGCNAYTISLTPNGRYIATGHPSGDNQQLYVLVHEVNADGTFALVDQFPVSGSPLGVRWISDTHLAVTQSSFGGTNAVNVYEFDPDGPGMALASSRTTSGFTTWLAVDHQNQRLFAQQSTPNSGVWSYEINPDGTIGLGQFQSTGSTYPLGIGVSPDGSHVYGGGGISSGGNAIVGVNVDTDDGSMSIMSQSPFTSPGASPKQVVVTDNGEFAVVGHGTDATVRTFHIDRKTGALTATGSMFDVGFQGSLSDVAVMGELVFATDNTTALDGIQGIYSFTLSPDGSLSPNGNIVDTQGIGPRGIAVWNPASCPADLNKDSVVDVLDLLQVLGVWGSCDGCPEDLNEDGLVNVLDLLDLLSAWGACP